VIRALRVRDLATIEELELEPGPGLNVVTGETGAGKSVLLGAVALLAGRRVTRELVRSGAEEARVEAILADAALLDRARALGLAAPDDAELLIARSVSREGRSRVAVNGHLATVALLAELVGDLLEIASQGEHHALLQPELQLQLLDRHGGLDAQAARVAQLHEQWRAGVAAIEQRRAGAEALARREDQLRLELEQIERAAPRAGELEELESEHARLAHVERLGEESARALEALDGADGVRDRLGEVQKILRELARLDPALGEASGAGERAALESAELAAQLERYRAGLEADPARLARVEARWAELRRLQVRYGSTVEAILAHAERARAELTQIGGGELRTAELEAELAAIAEQLDAEARRLSTARAEVARELEARVARELAALDLGRARFFARLVPASGKTPEGREAPAAACGRERVEFALSANPGEEPRRLRDAASGGELARLSLALRNVLREAEQPRVLLFDEIDAGVGGRTAHRVGECLRALAARHQVLCITHLPQIAALGQTHYRVVKRVRASRTRTAVERLDDQTRVDEIARMASGGRLTDAARAHARELLAAR
jgi:DNA repair protein RecN (Recombination protein N)